MFACSMYPADPDTLANVEKEVTHQVKKANYLYLSLFIVYVNVVVVCYIV